MAQRELAKDRLERCLRQVEEKPQSARAHYNLGLAYTNLRKGLAAEKAYLEAVRLQPDLTEAWVNLGGVRLHTWDFKGCLEATQEAVRQCDDLPVAHFNQGQAYLYLNDAENLLKCNKRVLELEPDNAAAHYFCAVGHLSLAQHGAAERHLGRAMDLGHQPTPEFLKAMERAGVAKAEQESSCSSGGPTIVEITGAKAPDKPKED